MLMAQSCSTRSGDPGLTQVATLAPSAEASRVSEDGAVIGVDPVPSRPPPGSGCAAWTSTTWSGSAGSAPRSRSRSASAPARRGPFDVALYTTASVDGIVPAHPEADWEQLRAVEKGRRSPLASLRPAPAPA